MNNNKRGYQQDFDSYFQKDVMITIKKPVVQAGFIIKHKLQNIFCYSLPIEA